MIRSERFDPETIIPGSYSTLGHITKFIRKKGIEEKDLDLINILVANINGCAYCINSHTQEALDHGETKERIFAINNFEEFPWFSDREKTVLRVANEITLIAQEGLTNKTYESALGTLGEEYLTLVILATISINSWTRIGRSMRLIPG